MTVANGRNIIICCDGTGNEFGRNNTNVVRLYQLLEDDDQKTYYDPGVGTSSSAIFSYSQKLSQVFTQAFGLDLHRNVEEAYLFLMNHYEHGDRIFLFGFSRGAHTVRRLTSMLEKCGLLYKGSENMIPYVTRMYNHEEDPKLLNEFKSSFTKNCPVHFLGVWDTVSAVSSLLPRPKLDGELSQELGFAYHAVAIDEKRFQFPPNLFKKETIAQHLTYEEVWFAGVHSDVGGFYDSTSLSNIPLRWMLQKAKDAGMKIPQGKIDQIHSDPLGNMHESWTGRWLLLPFTAYFFLGIATVFVAQLIIAFFDLWWNLPWRPFTILMEYLYEFKLMALAAVITFIILSRKRRGIPVGSKIHESVKLRLESEKANYKPKNLLSVINKICWVK